MSKICATCGKAPAVGNNVSHSHRHTKRRFDPNLQRVRIVVDGHPQERLRLHPLPQVRPGHQGHLSTRNAGPRRFTARPFRV